MTASNVTEHYEASPDEAWALLGDFEGLARVFPGVTDVVTEGGTRTFSLMGMRITERLVERDEEQRTLTYSVIDGIAVDQHRATIEVRALGSGCEVSWSVTTEPEAAQPLFADAYRSALQSLHATLDAT